MENCLLRCETWLPSLQGNKQLGQSQCFLLPSPFLWRVARHRLQAHTGYNASVDFVCRHVSQLYPSQPPTFYIFKTPNGVRCPRPIFNVPAATWQMPALHLRRDGAQSGNCVDFLFQFFVGVNGNISAASLKNSDVKLCPHLRKIAMPLHS